MVGLSCRPPQLYVIPDGAKRRSGIHSGAFPIEVPEWVPGLPSVARDDPSFAEPIDSGKGSSPKRRPVTPRLPLPFRSRRGFRVFRRGWRGRRCPRSPSAP
ncbi:hypothetical protein BOSE62_10002 [Bosea sp. 62]|nr:hypothetical protein BOSE21B_120013 [Bosea sp. 21B]VXA92889.1 hypothetical protein BOSE62_10002 [Bosea sp. 62]